jgi:hypothetical protein
MAPGHAFVGTLIAAKIAALPKGSHCSKELSQKQAARLLKTSVPSIKRAKTVHKQGTPELVAAVEAGDENARRASKQRR